MNKPTAESHFKAYAETGLHDLTHRFIGEVGSHWSEQQGPQNLQRTVHNDTWMRSEEKVGFLQKDCHEQNTEGFSRSHFKLNVVLKKQTY